MNSANDAQKIEDPEKQFLHAPSPSISTRSSPRLDTSYLKQEDDLDAKSKKMMKIQHLCFSFVLLALLGLTLVSCSSPPSHGSPMSPEEKLQFQALLNTVEPASLHDVLHKHLKEKYQHGVYLEDKAAMEVVAQSNVEVAHSLIEVAKRQASNTTTVVATVTTTTAVTTDVPPVTTTSVVVPPTTTPGTTPPTTSPTDQATTSPTQQTQQTQPPSTATTTTPTTVQTSSTTPTSSKSGSTTSPTKSGTSNVKSSSAPDTLSTEVSSSRSVTQQTIFTTTLQNGAISTVTSVTVVPAGQAEKTGSVTKTSGNASLQTNAANSGGLGLGGVVGMLGIMVAGAL